jgi:hypothetical protein
MSAAQRHCHILIGLCYGSPVFHLLKWGVTEESALTLIWVSFLPQALQDAVNLKMKNDKVVLAIQTELDNDFYNMMRRTFWVDITRGMETSK